MRILVVEDEHRIANSIKKGLEQEKYAADAVYTGPDGYDMAVTEDYDLIILDLMLPGLSGIQICQKLRTDAIHTPILILTAKGQTEDKVAGLDAGADDYLIKPFTFEELLARVRALLRRPRHTINNILSVGSLIINLSDATVSRHGQNITLSRREYSLLEYLMRNPDRILSKDVIISHVWNYDANILPNTVEVYIRKLRHKIDHPFPREAPLIRTVRGFGYKLSEPNP